jgi:CheY-like chemotaxis protein
MPVMDGYEATKAVRASERKDLQEIPIVAMTADAFTDDVKHATQVGMNGHLSKPIEIDKLLKALEKWL